MTIINRQDTDGTKAALSEGELGYDKQGTDRGRVYVGTDVENIKLLNEKDITANLFDATDGKLLKVGDSVNLLANGIQIVKTKLDLVNMDTSNLSDGHFVIAEGHQYTWNATYAQSDGTVIGKWIPEAPQYDLYGVYQYSITTVNTLVRIQFPLDNAVTLDWGDGTVVTTTATGWQEHNYAEKGTYTVTIQPNIYWRFWDDASVINITKIISIYTSPSLTSMFVPYSGPSDVGNLTWHKLELSKNVTSLQRALSGLNFNPNVNDWDISNVTSLEGTFVGSSSFNQPLDNWDTSNVTNMKGTFSACALFDQNLNSWNTSKVTNFRDTFQNATLFNGNISNWDVSSGLDFMYMFNYATSFNMDVSNWDMSSAENLLGMFRYATAFNSDISGWDVSNVTTMQQMFQEAISFDQNLGAWDISNVVSMYLFLSNVTLSTANYDATLIGWDALPNPQWSTANDGAGVTCTMGNSVYTLGGAAEAARTSLIAKGLLITDGGGI